MTVLDELYAVLQQRKEESPDKSYVAGLYNKGTDAILKKVGEESTEVVIAGKDDDDSQVVYEMADLWFHCMVFLSHRGLSHDDVLSELQRRFGLSGLDEKKSRTSND